MLKNSNSFVNTTMQNLNTVADENNIEKFFGKLSFHSNVNFQKGMQSLT